jgi:hypothetical protein
MYLSINSIVNLESSQRKYLSAGFTTAFRFKAWYKLASFWGRDRAR